MGKINRKNLKRLCGLNGMTPSELCDRIRRHKTTVYKALQTPGRFGPTMARIEAALPIREVPRG